MLNRASANSKPIANLHDRKVIKRQKQDAVKSFPAADAPSAVTSPMTTPELKIVFSARSALHI